MQTLSAARRLGRIAGFFLVCLAAPAQAQAPAAGLTPAQIARTAIPSVVLIRTPTGLGSGFVAAAGGKIVTNFHVVRGATQASVVTSDGKEYKDIEVLSVDEPRDLVVLRTAARGLTPLTLGDSSQAKPGDHVVAIGNPLGLGDTVSDGLLSGLRELANLSLLEISAPISPGSSGGPVFNDHGEVIGVSALVIAGGQNLNFAVPINAVKAMLTAESGKPLAAYADAGLHRDIPHHPRSLLNQCPAPQQRRLIEAIARAIDVGAPLYNQGNVEACYRIYEGAALEIQRTTPQCPGPKRALADGLSEAAGRPDWSGKAWAMRDAFDGLIAVVVGDEATKAGGVQRHIPDVAPAALDACPAPDIAAIGEAINTAIAVGAPLYNDGNIEACYRIYAGAISEIDQKFTRCPAARQVLDTGLQEADLRQGWDAKAWALRDSFDGLLKAIDARPHAAN